MNCNVKSSLWLFAVGSILASFSSARAEDSCRPVFDALTKLATTPTHSYSTYASPSIQAGKPTSSESIYFHDKAFMRLNGTWMTGPETPKETLDREQENRKRGHATCSVVRSEPVNGEEAIVYSLHSQSEHAKEIAEIWISNRTKLPLREEADIDIGESTGKSHLSIRYEYNNVHPPM
jgi:hypothetical protein